MTRDPNRIPKVLETLLREWMRDADMRLGQLIVNAATRAGVDPFYIEDEVLCKYLSHVGKKDFSKKKVPPVITAAFLRNNNDVVFVFGDNNIRYGKRGAATLRDEENTFGFITKREPSSKSGAFYTPDEYKKVFDEEIKRLEYELVENDEVLYLISKLGSGLANRFNIFEEVIEPQIKERLGKYPNVQFLW